MRLVYAVFPYGCIAVTILFGACRAQEGDKMNEKKTNGQLLKEALEATNKLPDSLVCVLRDDSQLNWTSVFAKWGYHLTHSSELIFQRDFPPFSVRTMEWDVEKGSHAQEIRLTVAKGTNGPAEARERLFEMVGAGTTRMITPSTFEVLRDGPGDLCIIIPKRWTNEYKQGKILNRMSFVRDNIGVDLLCSGDTDLLPIARDLDQVIASCPQLPKAQEPK